MKHQEIIESLPWYVNGTLDQAERAAVTQHLASGCDECAREVKSLRALHKAVKASGDEAPEPSPFLLNRALAEIEDYERTRAQEQSRQAAKAPASPSLWDRLWPKTPVFARVALATQLALVLVLGAVAVYQYENPRVIYRTTSDSSGTKAKLSVIFNENATEGGRKNNKVQGRRCGEEMSTCDGETGCVPGPAPALGNLRAGTAAIWRHQCGAGSTITYSHSDPGKAWNRRRGSETNADSDSHSDSDYKP